MAKETLQFVIDTIFNKAGLQKAGTALKRLTSETSTLTTQIDNFQNKLSKAEGVKRFHEKLKSAGIGLREVGNSAEFFREKNGVAFKSTENAVAQYIKTIQKIPKAHKDAATKVVKSTKTIKKKLTGLEKTTKKFGTSFKADQFAEKMDQVGLSVSKTGQITSKTTGETIKASKASKMYTDMLSKQQKQAALTNKAMGSLSFLFLGQAMATTFQRIGTAATLAFMEITEGQTEAGQGMTALSANLEFLKFTMGNAIATALLPMVPALIGVISKVSEWVALHPKLTAWGLGAGFVAGKIFSIGASAILAFAGLRALVGGSAFTTLTAASTADKIGILASAISTGLGGAIAAGIGVLVLTWAFNKEEINSAFSDLVTAVKNKDLSMSIDATFDLIEGFKTGWDNLFIWINTKTGEYLGKVMRSIVNFFSGKWIDTLWDAMKNREMPDFSNFFLDGIKEDAKVFGKGFKEGFTGEKIEIETTIQSATKWIDPNSIYIIYKFKNLGMENNILYSDFGKTINETVKPSIFNMGKTIEEDFTPKVDDMAISLNNAAINTSTVNENMNISIETIPIEIELVEKKTIAISGENDELERQLDVKKELAEYKTLGESFGIEIDNSYNGTDSTTQ